MFSIRNTKTIERKALFSGGYTIIETMIVLVVSSLLFASVVLAISMQNRRTQFTQSVQTFQQRLGDVLNDVETGYFPPNSGGTTTCTSGAQGTNKDCIFIGKAITSAVLPTENLDVYTLSGNRVTNPGSKEVSDLSEANPHAITSDEGTVDSINIDYGVEVYRIVPLASTNLSIPGFAVVSGFGQTSNGTLTSGYSTQASLATLSGMVNDDGFLGDNNIVAADKGILLCLREKGGGGRYATITIGEGSQKLAVQSTIDSVNPACSG